MGFYLEGERFIVNPLCYDLYTELYHPTDIVNAFGVYLIVFLFSKWNVGFTCYSMLTMKISHVILKDPKILSPRTWMEYRALF